MGVHNPRSTSGSAQRRGPCPLVSPTRTAAIRHPGRRAFTLVELLVVVAIFAVLLAMLLPAISRARRQMNLTQCTANLRELGQAMMVYATRNNGCLIIGYPGSAQPEHNNWYYDGSWNRYIHLGMLTHENILAPKYLVNQKRVNGTNAGVKVNIGFAPKRFFCPLETSPRRTFANNVNPPTGWVAATSSPWNPWPPVVGQYTQLGYGTRPSNAIHIGQNPDGKKLWNVPVKYDPAGTPIPIPWSRLQRQRPRAAWAADYIPRGSSGLRTSHPEFINVLSFDLSVRRVNVAGGVKAAITNGHIGTSTGHVWPELDKQ